MIHEIKFTRVIVNEPGDTSSDELPNQKIEMTVDGQATLNEVIAQFESFLKACNYYPPEGQILMFVKVE
jgi:hypothetical protein